MSNATSARVLLLLVAARAIVSLGCGGGSGSESTGLDPSSTGMDSGKLPKGAIVGRNSFGKTGYSICPPNGHETYVFALYALPSSIPAQKGFDPKALRERVLGLSGNSGLMAVGYG